MVRAKEDWKSVTCIQCFWGKAFGSEGTQQGGRLVARNLAVVQQCGSARVHAPLAGGPDS